MNKYCNVITTLNLIHALLLIHLVFIHLKEKRYKEVKKTKMTTYVILEKTYSIKNPDDTFDLNTLFMVKNAG